MNANDVKNCIAISCPCENSYRVQCLNTWIWSQLLLKNQQALNGMDFRVKSFHPIYTHALKNL